jgi:predicted DsbA family dithiol-disulfide isomerase
MSEYSSLRVDVWFDYGCPFSYTHGFVLGRFIEIYGPDVEVYWHPIGDHETEPPTGRDPFPLSQHEWERFVVPLADEAGVTIVRPRHRVVSNRAAALALAASQVGKFDAVHSAIFEAYFVSGRDIDDLDCLLALAKESGVAFVYPNMSDDMRAQVSRVGVDQKRTHSGLTCVPFTLLSRHRKTSNQLRPVQIVGAAPLRHLHAAVSRLFPEGYRLPSARAAKR